VVHYIHKNYTCPQVYSAVGYPRQSTLKKKRRYMPISGRVA